MRPFRLLFGTLILALASPAFFDHRNRAAAQDVFQWPRYEVRRFTEDYSQLSQLKTIPARNSADSLKYIPLSQDGSVWLSLGGQARLRYEGVRHFQFTSNASDSAYFLQRYFLWGDLNLGRNARIFSELKSAFATDRDLPGGRRAVDHDEFDFHNAFLELRFPHSAEQSLLLRGGRQELLYGKQRLISPLDWANSRRTWDGFLSALEFEKSRIDAFYTRPVAIRQYDINKRDDDRAFWGLYSTIAGPGNLISGVDLYFLGLEHDHGPSPDMERYTAGGRIWGKTPVSNLTYDLEAGYQFGREGGEDVRAFALASDLEYRVTGNSLSPLIYAGFDYASGDSNPGDGRNSTFNQLFPLGHAYLGYADVAGRQNIFNLRGGVRLQLLQRLWLQTDIHNFWLPKRQDALYNAGGAVVRRGQADARRYVGTEIDFTAGYSFNHNLQALVGYSFFLAGHFIDDTGGGSDIHYWYTQLTLTF